MRWTSTPATTDGWPQPQEPEITVIDVESDSPEDVVVDGRGRMRLQRQIAAQDAHRRTRGGPIGDRSLGVQADGETYRKVWGSADTEAKRRLLLRSGISAALKNELDGRRSTSNLGVIGFQFRVPSEIKQNLSLSGSDDLSAGFAIAVQ